MIALLSASWLFAPSGCDCHEPDADDGPADDGDSDDAGFVPADSGEPQDMIGDDTDDGLADDGAGEDGDAQWCARRIKMTVAPISRREHSEVTSRAERAPRLWTKVSLHHVVSRLVPGFVLMILCACKGGAVEERASTTPPVAANDDSDDVEAPVTSASDPGQDATTDLSLCCEELLELRPPRARACTVGIGADAGTHYDECTRPVRIWCGPPLVCEGDVCRC
jgi:hypothetical protein